MVYNTFFGKIKVDEISLDERELYRRLYRGASLSDSFISECKEGLYEVCDCSYCAVRTSVTFSDNGFLDLGFGAFRSEDLTKNLTGCREAFVFAATLGFSTERYLARLSAVSASKHFVTDALASGLVESVCDMVQENITRGMTTVHRFSPGYGDFDISNQRRVIDFISADKLLGITITKSGLMQPQKTVTAVVGIKNEQNFDS